MKLRKLQYIFSGLCSVVVSVVVGVSLYTSLGWSHTDNRIIQSSPTASSPTPATKIPPTRIRISAIEVDIPIQAARVNGNTWDMFDTAIAWLSTSAVVGEGNVILYGHNKTKLFRDIYKLKAGDTVEVLTNNTWRTYTVTESRAVLPSDVDSILADSDQLTMYTCEGTFDQKRRVVYAR